ncbi:hypothetical protein EOA75_24560 [Mesorhizobium sp. M1A.F.Ca.IN.022.07.1.1]|uniref:hypothetical protein n=1 Tax=unclassified Mesorhizobium TaxID=325217 RepID=UPI000BAF198E|nr:MULTISPECIES: hypothetical protein [unclassified Mesorhizobium]TGV91731.1 hypothetical protein EN801_012265 [Mesorhizobium sp. M00.F.Ca.ET.158.01.1.1]AZO58836.1 hypothetical protein EJ078_05615 [Mesorhizobium sp. M1A.F.Ca.IN.022.06.1.1]MCT2578965.1 hypothetical protein [Mesorhizobium sp. P13.3]MDF3167905.1 hypothetical protein [Mesorhizobium sp. P16.1]MDF3178211.1 hypothetical protein [Mesorhizobium sp. P17.1]
MRFSLAGRPRGLALGIWITASCAGPLAICLASTPCYALSEIQREELPSPVTPSTSDETTAPGTTVPMPAAPGTKPSDNSQPADETDKSAPEAPTGSGGITSPRSDPDSPPPPVVYDLDKLPEPVKRMHGLIIEACKSGDIEKLRPLIGSGESMTQLSLGDIEGDPVAFLKGLSGDGDGQEILAILEEVLSAGYVHVDTGTPQELYVWPYFFALPLDKLDPRQRVELFKLVTASDYDDMKQFGAYIFYRVGITPAGQWLFFVAGD